MDGQGSRTEWNPANILLMTRPIPISSKPRTVISTGHARFEWTSDGGCPEVRNISMSPKNWTLNVASQCYLSQTHHLNAMLRILYWATFSQNYFQRVDSVTLPHIKENNVIALVQAVKQMENERDRIKRIPVSF